VDYEHFNYPRYRPPHIGLYTVPWNQRRDKRFGSNRCKIDDNMAFQGSCWFTTAEHFRTVIGRLVVNKFWPVPTWPKDWREQLQQNPIPSWEEVLRINRG
jgi:hypothetical protein